MRISSPVLVNGIIQALSDEYSRKIILSATLRPKSVEDLSKENDIPMSTCYRRVHELVAAGIMIIDKIIITPEGKKFEIFRSAFRSIQISFEAGELVVEAVPNEDIAERLARMWLSMRA